MINVIASKGVYKPLRNVHSRGKAIIRKARHFSSGSKKEPELPTETDVVIVGGGAIGSSIAYHLEKRNVKVVLLERHELTAGTTWHSAGMLWRLRPSDTDIQLHAYTRWLLKTLEKSTEVSSFTENGGLFVANSQERLMEYQRLSQTGKYFGIESHMLTPDEIPSVHPVIDNNAVIGAMYSPTDGTIDPTSLVNAYAKACKQESGGRRVVYEGVSVEKLQTSIENGKPKVSGVVTEGGQQINAKWVVNAGGGWANTLTSDIPGSSLPLCTMRHAFVVTETIEGVKPSLPNVRDHDRSIYIKTQGNALALGGYETNPIHWENPEKDFAFGLFDLDFDAFNQNLEGHLELCPQVEEAGIQSTVCGPESFTPDHKPLVGIHPKINNYFVACGMNSMGIMLSGGLGLESANWIIDGSPDLDIFSFDIARFHPDCNLNSAQPTWLFDRSHESYAKTYAIVYPKDEPLAGRNCRLSGVHDTLEERGCIFQERHGFERPGYFEKNTKGEMKIKDYDFYGAYPEEKGEKYEHYPYRQIIEHECTFNWPASHETVAEECKAAREGVAIFDQSYFGKFLITGAEAEKAVDYVATARLDSENCPPGRVTYTSFCNEKGGVEADLTVTNLPEGSTHIVGEGGPAYYVAAGGLTATHNLRWLEKYTKAFDCQIKDISNDFSMISIQGPFSRELLSMCVSDPESTKCLEDVAFSHAGVITIDGIDMLVLRLTFVGELGFELHCPKDKATQILDQVYAQAEKLSAEKNVKFADAGYHCIDSLSAEKGYRHWHADLSNADTPMEAGIGFTVIPTLKNSKKEFVGKKALEEKREIGLKRKLICLTLDDQAPLHGLETIHRNGECVGIVKSTAYGHTIGKTIAYGYVAAEGYQARFEQGKIKDTPDVKDAKITKKWLTEGDFEIGDKGKMWKAEVHLQAPFDPKNTRINV